jgi:hypothetical protein
MCKVGNDFGLPSLSPTSSTNASSCETIDTKSHEDALSSPTTLWEETPLALNSAWEFFPEEHFFEERATLKVQQKHRFQTFVECMNSGDMDRLAEHYREALALEVVHMDPNGTTEGIEQVASKIKCFRAAFKNFKLSWDLAVNLQDGRHDLLMRLICSGTQICPFYNQLPIGEEVHFCVTSSVKETSAGKPSLVHWQIARLDPMLNILQMVTQASPHVLMDNTELETREIKAQVKVATHNRGECKPCSYFVFKKDGCWKGEDCEFCHLCPKTVGRKAQRHMAKERKMKARSVEVTSQCDIVAP